MARTLGPNIASVSTQQPEPGGSNYGGHSSRRRGPRSESPGHINVNSHWSVCGGDAERLLRFVIHHYPQQKAYLGHVPQGICKRLLCRDYSPRFDKKFWGLDRSRTDTRFVFSVEI